MEFAYLLIYCMFGPHQSVLITALVSFVWLSVADSWRTCSFYSSKRAIFSWLIGFQFGGGSLTLLNQHIPFSIHRRRSSLCFAVLSSYPNSVPHDGHIMKVAHPYLS